MNSVKVDEEALEAVRKRSGHASGRIVTNLRDLQIEGLFTEQIRSDRPSKNLLADGSHNQHSQVMELR